MSSTLVIGKIISAFGIQGWVKIYAYTEVPMDVFCYQQWHIDGSEYEVIDYRAHGSKLTAKLASIDTRDAATALAGQYIRISRAILPVTNDDEYYWHDLIGLRVYRSDNTAGGIVQNLIRSGAHDILVINDNGNDVLVPFVATLVPEVSITGGYLRIEAAAYDTF